MAYIDYEYYKTLFGEKAIPEADFNRLVWDSCKKIDNATTGVDNVKKLKIAFPTDEDDAEAVKRCVCELLTITYKIEQAEAKVAKTREVYEKAVDELKKLYDIRKAYQRDELLKAMENSSRSYDEILAFITSEDALEDEEK